MAITMLRRVGLRPRLHRRGPEAVAKPPPRWLLYSEGDPTAGLCMVVAGAQSRKIFTCRRKLGTRSWFRLGFHLEPPGLRSPTSSMLHPERVHAFNGRVTDSPHPCERQCERTAGHLGGPGSGLTRRSDRVRTLRTDAPGQTHARAYPWIGSGQAGS